MEHISDNHQSRWDDLEYISDQKKSLSFEQKALAFSVTKSNFQLKNREGRRKGGRERQNQLQKEFKILKLLNLWRENCHQTGRDQETKKH